MKTFVITGGNSGVGLQSAHELIDAGNRVIILGRDKQKGENAMASFGVARNRAVFLSVDLATHDGVKDAARQINEITNRIDGLLHSAGIFDSRDIRTKDGLPLFYALAYLGRYHLTQLLLPKLLKADHPRVIMMVGSTNKVPKLDMKKFQSFEEYNFWKMTLPIAGACMYYADYLTKTYPKIFAGCTTPGVARTEIFKSAPWYFRAGVALAGPFLNSVELAARNPVQALLKGKVTSAYMWNKPGNFQRKFAIEVNKEDQKALIDMSHKLTGA
ncbi:SDR family NAD(P)-dependent oxidoreductase [Paenibacillus pabuli]|uniref:SDR family NAD(P)-dependent oxidoreductase n=1 Tax=Paenibacillus pabuli TaxID=1472 RepID=UPI001FFF1252|nr:SDR family NAD(P)-dependent oxidoreductase [Paenibacillus pabuli]UPK41328.1 SDR family NAD(P)-dependent oxidoreductase [Paenibacillus pabuli]